MKLPKDVYPHPEDLSNLEKQYSLLPTVLADLLTGITKSKKRDLKVAAIGQAIVQAARPRAIIAPLQLGLGVQMHHHFISKHLVQTLHKLGFSSSYSEVQKFRMCAAISPKGEELQNTTEKVYFITNFCILLTKFR